MIILNLTKEQQEILDGKQGDILARIMKTLVRYGELFGADSMVPVTSQYNHLVTSFGLKALTPVYELMDRLIESGNVSKQKFSADPRPLDPNVPSSFLQNIVFKNFMYSCSCLLYILTILCCNCSVHSYPCVLFSLRISKWFPGRL